MSLRLTPSPSPRQALDIARQFLLVASQETTPVPETGEELCEPVTHLKLQKLLYFAQAAHLSLFGTPLFADDIEAWALGPVVPSVYRVFARFNDSVIPPAEAARTADPDIAAFLQEIWRLFGKYSAGELVHLSHEIGPWRLLYREGQQSVAIPQDLIRSAFQNVFVARDDTGAP